MASLEEILTRFEAIHNYLASLQYDLDLKKLAELTTQALKDTQPAKAKLTPQAQKALETCISMTKELLMCTQLNKTNLKRIDVIKKNITEDPNQNERKDASKLYDNIRITIETDNDLWKKRAYLALFSELAQVYGRALSTLRQGSQSYGTNIEDSLKKLKQYIESTKNARIKGLYQLHESNTLILLANELASQKSPTATIAKNITLELILCAKLALEIDHTNTPYRASEYEKLIDELQVLFAHDEQLGYGHQKYQPLITALTSAYEQAKSTIKPKDKQAAFNLLIPIIDNIIIVYNTMIIDTHPKLIIKI